MSSLCSKYYPLLPVNAKRLHAYCHDYSHQFSTSELCKDRLPCSLTFQISLTDHFHVYLWAEQERLLLRLNIEKYVLLLDSDWLYLRS